DTRKRTRGREDAGGRATGHPAAARRVVRLRGWGGRPPGRGRGVRPGAALVARALAGDRLQHARGVRGGGYAPGRREPGGGALRSQRRPRPPPLPLPGLRPALRRARRGRGGTPDPRRRRVRRGQQVRAPSRPLPPVLPGRALGRL
ncbi:MAG: hypothetical protein AVDCRST_MAG02-104, partial [uncultured Rubrobacteraceae bacterium]